MKEIVTVPPDKRQSAEDTFAVFSLPALQEEVETMRKKHGTSLEGELRRRIKHGVDSYFRILAGVEMRAKKDAAGDGTAPQSVEEAGAAFVKSFFGAFAKEGVDHINAENRIALFGGSGKGSELILQSIRNIADHLKDGNLVGLVKKEIENLAMATIASSEGDEDAREDAEGIDDLAGMIASNITEYDRELPSETGDSSMLSTWGSGTALTILPNSVVIKRREARKAARPAEE